MLRAEEPTPAASAEPAAPVSGGTPSSSLFPAVSGGADTAPGTVEWLTGDGVSLGGFLFPHLHVFSVFGGSTGDPAELANGHHDPQGNATLQALEPGLSLRLGKHVQGFATYSAYTDASGRLDGELEEGFLKLVELPFDLELRGGLFRNRFGFQNAVHNHGWLFVDQNLVNGRLLQEGELATLGGEVTWNLPTPWTSALSASIGGLNGGGHDHDHGEGHGHEEGHGGEPEFDAGGARFANYLAGAHYIAKYDHNDFHQFTGTLSGAWGENEFGRNTSLYGVGLEYLWRQNGYEPGGLSLRWRNEVMLRKIDAFSGHLHGEESEEHEEHEEEHHAGGHGHEEHEDEHEHEHGHEARHAGTVDEVGAYSMLVLGLNDRLEAGVRGGWVGGIEEMALAERWQVSPMMTYYLNDKRTLLARVQYNWDHGKDFGGEHSVWFQLGFNWGGAEVR